MNGIETNYNMPIPVEQVKGQTIAGPEAANTQSQTPEVSSTEQSNQTTTESQKGTNIDTSA